MEIGRVLEEDLETLIELYQQLQSNEPSLAKMRQTLIAVEQNPNHIILWFCCGNVDFIKPLALHCP